MNYQIEDRTDAEALSLTEILEALVERAGGPSEEDHWEADVLVAAALRKLDQDALADAYENVGKWFA